MKIIDLLNKIANSGEVPKKIKYDTLWYEFRNYDYKEIHKGIVDEQTSFVEKIDFYKLNDEVEIIEEDKKIERFEPCLGGIMSYESVENIFEIYKDKINEIIEVLNERDIQRH